MAEDWSIGLTAVILQAVNWYILEHREQFFHYIRLKKRKVDYEWAHKKKWNAFVGSAYLIAAYVESFVLCVRSSKKLLFKKSRI